VTASPDRAAASPTGRGERGAALIGAVLLATALAILAGAVGWFALVGSQTAAAARDHADVAAAVQAGLEIAAAALASEPDPAGVRLGRPAAAPRGTDRLDTADGSIDVTALTDRFGRRRGRRPPPADVAVWRPYAWGRLGELAPGPGATARDPLVVAWIRTDEVAGEGPDRFEVAVEAIGVSGARASAVALLRLGPRGASIVAVWPDAGIAGPG
jgi:hypothetical protein